MTRDIAENVPVSVSDDLVTAGGPSGIRSRRLGEFKPTNLPLSAFEIEHRRDLHKSKSDDAWIPRNAHNVEDLVPISEESKARS